LTDAACAAIRRLKQPECRIRSPNSRRGRFREALDKARACRHRKTLRGKCREEESHGDYGHELALALARTAKKAAAANRRGDQDNFSPHADGDEAPRSRARISQRLPRSRLVRRCAQGHSRRRAGLRTSRAGQGQAHPARVRLGESTGRSSWSMRGRPRWAMRSRASFAPGPSASSAVHMSTMPATSSRLRALRRRETAPGFGARRPSCREIPIRAEYLVDLVAEWLAADPAAMRALAALPEAERIERLGRMAVSDIVNGSGPSSRPTARGRHVVRTSRPTCGPGGWPVARHHGAPGAGHTYEQDGPSVPLDDLRRRSGTRPAQRSDGEAEPTSRWTSPSTTTANSDARTRSSISSAPITTAISSA